MWVGAMAMWGYVWCLACAPLVQWNKKLRRYRPMVKTRLTDEA